MANKKHGFLAAALLGAAALCALGALGILWWLPDVKAHGTARMAATAAAALGVMVFVLLDGGFTALRFGVARGKGCAVYGLFTAAQMTVRALSTLLWLGLAAAAVLCAFRWFLPRGAVTMLACMALMLGGYGVVLRFEKRLRRA